MAIPEDLHRVDAVAKQTMPDAPIIPILAVLLGAVSLWLMLPRGRARGRGIGAVLGAIALGGGAAQLPLLGQWVADGMFLVLAGVTVVSALGAITFRDPVYCAIWFGLSLVGVAGLFLLVGAQFLAAATIVVYAGAILVTFLFVIMLAQPEGKAPYDRVSWEASISAATGMMLVGVLSIAITGAVSQVTVDAGKPGGGCSREDVARTSEAGGKNAFCPRSEEAMAANVLSPQHVAHIGNELFGRHLIAIEVAGTLLLAALVGAAVIVGRTRGATNWDSRDHRALEGVARLQK